MKTAHLKPLRIIERHLIRLPGLLVGVVLLFATIGCAPSLTSSSWPERSKAVRLCDDQTLLGKVAVEDTHSVVRREALAKLTDQALIAKIAADDKERHVRIAAVGKLTDQTLLRKIATGDTKGNVRTAAVAKLTDQALIAKIAVDDKESYVRMAAVGELADQAVLRKIATGDTNAGVRRAAVAKLTDQALLAEIARKGDRGCRYTAASILTDADALLALSSEDGSSPVISPEGDLSFRIPLKDGNFAQIALLKLALLDPKVPPNDFTVTYTDTSKAYRKKVSGESVIIKGESLVISIYNRKTPKASVRRQCQTLFPSSVRRMFIPADGVSAYNLLGQYLRGSTVTADGILYDVVFSKPAAGFIVQSTLVNQLTDQSLLAKIALANPYSLVRTHAMRKLTDQSVLAKIALSDRNSNVRWDTVRKLTDKKLLAKIALEDKIPKVREAATKRRQELDNK